jgi:protein TonB
VSRRPWLGLGLSLALHASVLALAFVVLAREELLPALIVDLRDSVVPGTASVGSGRREARSVPSASAPRARKGKTETATRHGAPTVPVPAPVVEAPSSPPSPTSAPPREPGSLPSPPAPEPVEPRPSGSLAGATTGAGPPQAAAGSAVGDAGSAGGDIDTGGSVTASASPTGFEYGAGGRREGSGPTGPFVASVPPDGGSGVGAEYGPYLAALRQRIQQSVRYPASARRRGVAGTVSVEILILANGTIGNVTVLESSTHAVLDEAALDTIRSLPRMPLPAELPARPLRVRVPVVFQMR